MIPTMKAAFVMGLLLAPMGAYAGWADSCRNRQFILDPNQNTMHAYCGDGHGGYRDTYEDLNLCIGNSGGNLVWGNSGNFGFSCHDCRPDGTFLICVCGDGHGGYNNDARIDTNEVIQNLGGHLDCFGHYGT